MTNENHTDNDSGRWYFASDRSDADRVLHADGDCQHLRQANDVESQPVSELPTGDLCQDCASDVSLEELASDDEELPSLCPSCSYADSTDGSEFWSRTPQGRPACPECGMIPEGFELRTMEVPADD